MEKILLVDDEQFVLDGLQRQLRKKYDVSTAKSGEEGLQRIILEGPFAVILSDMRMPVMDGIAFLTEVRKIAPESVRMMLTGNADQQTAAAAINRGAIFRFLTKPCSHEDLTAALDAALDQYRLITAEKELLEKTLKGSIQILVDILSLAAPAAFSQAMRLKKYAVQMVRKLNLSPAWQYEIAAMLTAIGYINIPPETIDRYMAGEDLTEEEKEMIDSMPQTTGMLLANIPRLSVVASMITQQNAPCSVPLIFDGGNSWETVRVGGNLLKVLTDFDLLIFQKHDPEEAIRIMSKRRGLYSRTLLDMLNIMIEVIDRPHLERSVRNVRISDLKKGMIIDMDVYNAQGILVIPRGYEVNESTCERIRNFLTRQSAPETIRVLAVAYSDEGNP